MTNDKEIQLFFKCERLIKKYGVIGDDLRFGDENRYAGHKYSCRFDPFRLDESEFEILICSEYGEGYSCIYDKLNEKISKSYLLKERSSKELPAIDVLQHIENELLVIDKTEKLRTKLNSLFIFFLNISFFELTTYSEEHDFKSQREDFLVLKSQEQNVDFEILRKNHYIDKFEIRLKYYLKDYHQPSSSNYLSFIPEAIYNFNFNSLSELRDYLIDHSYFQSIRKSLVERFEIEIDIKEVNNGLFLMMNKK